MIAREFDSQNLHEKVLHTHTNFFRDLTTRDLTTKLAHKDLFFLSRGLVLSFTRIFHKDLFFLSRGSFTRSPRDQNIPSI